MRFLHELSSRFGSWIGTYFNDPWYLLLALAIPALIAWWLFQSRNALRHSAAQQILGSPTLRAHLARWGGAGLRALALLLLVLAIAGVRWPSKDRSRLETEGIAVVMVVDVSGSMAEEDYVWDLKAISRLQAVKNAFRLFVTGGAAPDTPNGPTASFKGRPTDQIGLVTFAARPERTCPLTLSHSALLRMLDASQPLSVPGESETNLSDAMVVGLQQLQNAGSRRKVLILLTDGEHNVVDPRSHFTPRQVGQLAASLDVPIYTIDAGRDTDETDATREQAKKTLNELATMTKGEEFPAHDTPGLLKACQAIDKLETDRIESFQYRLYDPWFVWFGLASFVVFLTGMILEQTLWRRVP